MNLEKLEAQLLLEEGSPPRTYLDTKGLLSGGIGHNLIAHPEPGYDRVGVQVGDAIRSKWFTADIATAIAELDVHLPWWRDQDDVRQNALLNLCFNMGIGGLLTFKNTLAAFERGDYTTAAAGIRSSKYAHDVGANRSGRVAKMIETGEWQL
jgi:lysozyme